MTDAFISYAREDQAFVRSLFTALEERQRDSWVDWEGIPPTAEWLAEIYAAIDSADAFLFVMSSESLASEICLQEVKHAVSRNKRLVPVVRQEAGDQEVPEALAKLNWIFLREEDDFAAGVDTLIEALDTDLDHVKLHTRYLERAVDWQGQSEDRSLALRGQDLVAAETWLAESGDKEPSPTSLHNCYILQSRRVTARRQRVTLAAVAAGVLVATVLGLLAVQQRNAKRQNRQRAIANQLVGESRLAREERKDALAESVQMAAEAMRRFDALGEHSLAADQELRVGLALMPPVPEADELDYRGDVQASAFSRLGRYLALVTTNGSVLVRDTVGRTTVGSWAVQREAGDTFRRIAVAESGAHAALWLYSSTEDRSRITLREVADGSEIAACDLARDFSGTGFELRLDGRLWLDRGLLRLNDCRLVWLWDERLQVKGTLSGDGRTVAAAVRDRLTKERWIEIRDLDDGGEIARWPIERSVSGLQLLDSGRRLAGVGATGRRLQIWLVEVPARRSEVELAESVIAIRDDGRVVAAREYDGHVVHLRSTAYGSEILRLVHPGVVRLAAFSADGRVLTTFEGKTVWRWEVSAGRVGASPGPRSASQLVAFGDGYLAAVAPAGVRVWSIDDWRLIAELPTQEKVETLGFRDGTLTFGDETARFLDTEDGWEVERAVPPPRSDLAADLDLQEMDLLAVVPCPDHGRLALNVGTTARGGWEARTEVWDRESGERLASFDLLETVGEGMKGIDDRSTRLLACSADGRYIAAPARDATVVREIATGRQIARLSHPGLFEVAFAPGGEFVATAGRGPVRLWRLDASAEIARLLQVGPPTDIAFSPDSRYLATASSMGVDVHLWRPNDLIAEACTRLESNLSIVKWQRLFPEDPYEATCPQLANS